MTKTIMILAIATAFVVGTIATGALVDAAKPETDPDGDLTMEGIVFEIVGLLKHPVFGLEEIKDEVRNIETSVADISDIKTEVSNIEGKLDGTTSSFVSDIKTETNKIQMIKDNQYVPFTKTETSLGTCASAGASNVVETFRIAKSGGSGDFIITGIIMKVGGVNPGAELSSTQFVFGGIGYPFSTVDLISGISGNPAVELLGAPTITGRTTPYQIALDSSITIHLLCTATANADLDLTRVVVSGWKKPGHTISIVVT